MPGWGSIIGLQFENLVLNNREFVLDQLHLRREVVIRDNPYFQRASKGKQGCQIDYLVQTKHNTLFVCEIRFMRGVIDSQVIAEVKAKIKALQLPRQFSCFPVVIHVNGVSDAVIDSGYFTEIIDFKAIFD